MDALVINCSTGQTSTRALTPNEIATRNAAIQETATEIAARTASPVHTVTADYTMVPSDRRVTVQGDTPITVTLLPPQQFSLIETYYFTAIGAATHVLGGSFMTAVGLLADVPFSGGQTYAVQRYDEVGSDGALVPKLKITNYNDFVPLAGS